MWSSCLFLAPKHTEPCFETGDHFKLHKFPNAPFWLDYPNRHSYSSKDPFTWIQMEQSSLGQTIPTLATVNMDRALTHGHPCDTHLWDRAQPWNFSEQFWPYPSSTCSVFPERTGSQNAPTDKLGGYHGLVTSCFSYQFRTMQAWELTLDSYLPRSSLVPTLHLDPALLLRPTSEPNRFLRLAAQASFPQEAFAEQRPQPQSP